VGGASAVANSPANGEGSVRRVNHGMTKKRRETPNGKKRKGSFPDKEGMNPTAGTKKSTVMLTFREPTNLRGRISRHPADANEGGADTMSFDDNKDSSETREESSVFETNRSKGERISRTRHAKKGRARRTTAQLKDAQKRQSITRKP